MPKEQPPLSDDEIRKKIGDQIALARFLCDRMPQEQLGALLGVPQSTISRWERGKGDVTAVMMYRIAKLLHSSIGTLYPPT